MQNPRNPNTEDQGAGDFGQSIYAQSPLITLLEVDYSLCSRGRKI